MKYYTNNSSTKAVAQTYLTYMQKLYCLPDSITLDRGSQFILGFWSYFCKQLGIKADLLTARYPKTNKQTKHVNAIAKAYLWSFVNYS